jgi:hypothetical protein
VNEPADTALHREVWNLIPWVVNGRASAAEQCRVNAHLEHCVDCREEYEFQRQLREAMHLDVSEDRDPQHALPGLWARLDANGSTPAADRGSRKSTWLVRSLAAAVIVEAVGLYALGGLLWWHNVPPSSATAATAQYRTLSSQPPSAATAALRVVLAPATTLAEFQQLLEQSHLQIVSGPSEAGVYSLAPVAPAKEAMNKDAMTHTLAQLRAHPAVRFAEPVGADTIP